jgi:hypothetical protein
MSGSSEPPAADGAPWIGPEQSQQNTQSETKPQSFGERLRHKGRHYLKKAPRFLYPQNKQPLLARWRSNPHKVKTDVHHQPSLPADYNPPVTQELQQLPWPASSPPPIDLKAMDVKKELQGLFKFPAQQQQQPCPTSIPQPAAVVNNVPFFDAEGHIVKPPGYRDWLKGHTTSRKRVNSAPVLSLGSLDLTGVGSQWDATNRPISALPTGTDQSTEYPQEQQQYNESTLVGRDIHRLIGLNILTSLCVNRINPRSQLGRHKSLGLESRSIFRNPVLPK